MLSGNSIKKKQEFSPSGLYYGIAIVPRNDTNTSKITFKHLKTVLCPVSDVHFHDKKKSGSYTELKSKLRYSKCILNLSNNLPQLKWFNSEAG